MTSPTTPHPVAAETISYLMKAAFLSEQRVLTDLALHAGLLWRCVCKGVNSLYLNRCGGCGEQRLWTKEVTPPRYKCGTLWEALRSALAEWFNDRPRARRPAAISFRVTTVYDDGPAWATWGVTAYFTDSPDGKAYKDDFERSFVADVLVEIGAFDQPQTGETIRVVIPPPLTPDRTTEYTYVIGEYAHEAARVLGEGWGSESGYIGAYGKLWGLGTPTLRVYVDHDDDLVVPLDDDADPMRFTVDLPNGAPTTPDELRRDHPRQLPLTVPAARPVRRAAPAPWKGTSVNLYPGDSIEVGVTRAQGPPPAASPRPPLAIGDVVTLADVIGANSVMSTTASRLDPVFFADREDVLAVVTHWTRDQPVPAHPAEALLLVDPFRHGLAISTRVEWRA